MGPPGTGKTFTGALILNALDLSLRATRDWAEQLRDSTIDLIAKETKEAKEAGKDNKPAVSAATAIATTGAGKSKRTGKGGTPVAEPSPVKPQLPQQQQQLSTDILDDPFLAQLPHVACLGPSNEAVDNVLRRVMQNGFFGCNLLFPSVAPSSNGTAPSTNASSAAKSPAGEQAVTLHLSGLSISQNVTLPTDSSTDYYRPFIVRIGNEDNMARDVYADSSINVLALVQNIVNLRWDANGEELANWKDKVKAAKLETLTKYHEISTQRKNWVLKANCSPASAPSLSSFSMQRSLQARYAALLEVEAQFHNYPNQAARALLPIFVDRAELVFSTCNALGGVSGYATRKGYDCVLIDESCQLRESEALLALLKAERVILIGDPAQLGPTVKYHGKHRAPLLQTLFSRLKPCTPCCALTVQYRMHPEISAFSSAFFYNSTIENGATKFVPTALPPYHLRNVKGREERVGTSFSNEPEAATILSLIGQLSPDTPFMGSIGVITPYLAQKAMLESALAPIAKFLDITVDTVDAFQGGEKDVILISCVRDGSGSASVGFLDDPSRINVAITRARSCCCIVLCVEAFEKQPVWRELIQNARQRNLITA